VNNRRAKALKSNDAKLRPRGPLTLRTQFPKTGEVNGLHSMKGIRKVDTLAGKPGGGPLKSEHTLNTVEGGNINGLGPADIPVGAVAATDGAEVDGLPAASAPSVLDIGRQIVRLSNKYDEMDEAILDLKRQGLNGWEVCKRERELALVDIALGMRAHTLGDVAVMLGLAHRVADLEAASEFDEEQRDRVLAQLQHALLTSLDVVIREAGVDLAETVGRDAQFFIDREHADLGDGL
jgi:hypothetical protein